MVFLGLDKLVCWEVSSNKAEMKEQDASNGEWCGVCSGRSCGLRCTSPCRAGTRPFLLVCSRIALDSSPLALMQPRASAARTGTAS